MIRRLAVPLASGIAYALTASKYVGGGDSAELAAVGASGGVAHPPGYPLFTLWCRFWQWLPAATPTHRVALATALSGALAVFMVERACRAWGARPLAAGIATAIFAACPLAWRLATEPEVFMLNIALALALVSVASPEPWDREERRAITLALLAGLGISNHHSIVLLAPLGLFAWGRAVGRTPKKVLAVLGSIGALVAGLLPYAYLLHAARGECVWGDTSTLAGLLHHFLRRDYGTTQLAVSTAEREPLNQLIWLGHSFLESGIALFSLLAIVVLTKRRRWSWSLAALLASILLAGPIFVTRFNLPPRLLNALVVVRFHLLPLALASVLGSAGIDAVVSLVRTRGAQRATLAAAVAAILVRAGLSGADAVTEHRPTIERYLRNTLAMLPPRAIFVVTGDDVGGGLEYMQCTLHERPDITVIVPPLLLAEWYGARTDERLGFSVVHGTIKPGDDRPSLNGLDLAEQLVRSDRPVFLTDLFVPNLDATFPSYPLGPLIRLLRRGENVPAPDELLRANEAIYAGFILDHPSPFAHTWAGVRYRHYARPWEVLAKAFDENGDFATAARCRARARSVMLLEPPSWE